MAKTRMAKTDHYYSMQGFDEASVNGFPAHDVRIIGYLNQVVYITFLTGMTDKVVMYAGNTIQKLEIKDDVYTWGIPAIALRIRTPMGTTGPPPLMSHLYREAPEVDIDTMLDPKLGDPIPEYSPVTSGAAHSRTLIFDHELEVAANLDEPHG